jgi:hypothetical protein
MIERAALGAIAASTRLRVVQRNCGPGDDAIPGAVRTGFGIGGCPVM